MSSPEACEGSVSVRALDGVRVLDLSRFVAGPFCCQILGDNGADVIKVEKPDGEPSRQMPPFARGHSLYFMAYNGSKRSITVNFRSQEGLALLRKLMAKVDVVVENFRAGTMGKMGLGYEAVAAENPGLIMVSISGFGVEGPYADRPAFDEIIQSMSGLASLSGDRDGPPMLTGTYVADFQGIQFLLVDMAANLEAARALVYDVAMRLEQSREPRHNGRLARQAQGNGHAYASSRGCDPGGRRFRVHAGVSPRARDAGRQVLPNFRGDEPDSSHADRSRPLAVGGGSSCQNQSPVRGEP